MIYSVYLFSPSYYHIYLSDILTMLDLDVGQASVPFFIILFSPLDHALMITP